MPNTDPLSSSTLREWLSASSTIQRLLGRCYELSLSTVPSFQRLLSPSGIAALFFNAVRKLFVQLADPTILVRTPYGLTHMPLSHELPTYYFWHPLYDSVIDRLSAYIRSSHGPLCLVDIGANIGDTALCARLTEDDCALLIEPTSAFRQCAKLNTGNTKASIEILDCFIGAVDVRAALQGDSHQGTARFRFDAGGTKVTLCTIDKLVFGRPHLKPNFIKIDTDGHDLECLQGARETIAAFRPYVLFEADVFDSADYCTAFLSCCSHFVQSGYEQIVVYSNIGNLLWSGHITDTSTIAQLLFYHITSGVLYYDILFIPPNSSFEKDERDFFAKRLDQESKRTAAFSCLAWIN